MTNDQLHPEARPAAPRTLDDWTATIAAAALVAGGFLVSIAGPMLRKLYDARVRELVELRELVAGGELVGQADELGGREPELVPDEAPPPGADVWTRAAGNGSADYAEAIGAEDG